MIYVGSLIFSQIGVLWPEHLAAGAAVGLSATPALAAPISLGGGLISANLASSTKVGSLSVPPTWSATAPKAAEQSSSRRSAPRVLAVRRTDRRRCCAS